MIVDSDDETMAVKAEEIETEGALGVSEVEDSEKRPVGANTRQRSMGPRKRLTHTEELQRYPESTALPREAWCSGCTKAKVPCVVDDNAVRIACTRCSRKKSKCSFLPVDPAERLALRRARGSTSAPAADPPAPKTIKKSRSRQGRATQISRQESESSSNHVSTSEEYEKQSK